MPLGRFLGSSAAGASSLIDSVRLVLLVEKTPSSKRSSSGSTCSMCAAMARALATTFSLARWKAEPAMAEEREPPVPSPKNTWSVSPWM